ncbi:hypothetical protein LB559_09025 [Mesorhizobium sp. BR1-1-3]|uniref:hypothetical protein n=1 Tax=Mesorhizobium sp. BR1-1-3 TaxID=2876651 RepID=UPI001CD165B0|nr:hypothetical protein [Mesorhizobium sp. BR1-1-3]MBZ9888080.1 hypothetical protein [Mesorhizobium sp. BR1-1-3]
MKSADLCSTDIELGTCHAACLEGCPTVDLETGDPVDGPIPTYRYDEDLLKRAFLAGFSAGEASGKFGDDTDSEAWDRYALSTPTAPVLAVEDGWVMVPKTALDWLFGEGPDKEGHWFGDGNFSTKGAYWWRIPFRAMLAASSQQGEKA